MEQKQTQTLMKTFGQRYHKFNKVQPVYLELTADKRVVMRALNPATSAYDITLFEASLPEVTYVSYFISMITLRVNGVIYRVILGDPISGRGISYGPLVFIPEARKARKLSGVDAWKTLFRRTGVKVRHQLLTPMALLSMLGLVALSVGFCVLAIRNAY